MNNTGLPQEVVDALDSAGITITPEFYDFLLWLLNTPSLDNLGLVVETLQQSVSDENISGRHE